jgi:hypothetical protein
MTIKETQQHERQISTASLTNHRVPTQGVTPDEKVQPPDPQPKHERDIIENFFLHSERALLCIVRYVCLGLAILNYVYSHEAFVTFLFIGVAVDVHFVRDAIELLFQWKHLLVAKKVHRKKSSKEK